MCQRLWKLASAATAQRENLENLENLPLVSLTVGRHAEAARPGTRGAHVRIVLFALAVVGPGGALVVEVLASVV